MRVSKLLILVLITTNLVFGARKFTSGFEKLKNFDTRNGSFSQFDLSLDPATGCGASTLVSLDTTAPYSGYASALFSTAGCGSGCSGQAGKVMKDVIGITTPIYVRMRVNFSAFPNPAALFCAGSYDSFFHLVGTGDSMMLRVDSVGHISLWVNGARSAVTAGTVSLNQWYLIQFKSTWNNSSPVNQFRVGRNGTDETVTDNTAITSGSIPTRYWWGLLNVVQAMTVEMDDIAVNDASGSYENSAPADSGRVVYLKPTADSSRGAWEGGGGGTTNLWLGAAWNPYNAFTCSYTADAGGVRHKTADTTNDCFLKFQTYTASGISAGAQILMTQGVVTAGDSGGTPGSKTGSIMVTSNPQESSEYRFTFTTINFCGSSLNDGCACDRGWRTFWSNPAYMPAVARGIAPTLRLGMRSISSGDMLVVQANILVEYSNVGVQDVQVITY